jgi:hypothetical protein
VCSSDLELLDPNLVAHYRQRGAEPVHCDLKRLRSLGYKVMVAPLQGSRPSATVRHDPRSVALAVMRFYRQIRRDSPRQTLKTTSSGRRSRLVQGR